MAVLSYSVIIENRIAKTGYTRTITNLDIPLSICWGCPRHEPG